ncbi:helix-turn-helix transcriptional regulator [Ectothiorhodospira variabilis]|uniref:helix-turn-helix transcriptional regulator n=1 Tax=Ectothiorhodospira variabilis TaxID=505694 RepID=UPI003B75C713
MRIISSIKSARAALGWTQPELAQRAGISKVALARLEAGLASPRLSTPLLKGSGGFSFVGCIRSREC